MSEFDYDLFVLGGGSGGVRVARWSGGLGAKVAICESDRFGGTCVIRGCIPKKFMVLGSHFLDEVHLMESYGWTTQAPRFDWKALKAARDKEISRLSGLYEGMLSKNKVDRFVGRGVVTGAHSVEVNGKTYTAKYIVVAVGGLPSKAPIPGVELGVTSDEMFEMDEQPKRAVIAGGGFIAVEFAGILRGFGSEVDVVIRADKILRGFDEDMRGYLQEELQKKGIRFHTGVTMEKISAAGTSRFIELSNGSQLEADAVLCATGRVPNTADLGLEEIGVKLGKRGEILVNALSQSSVDSIYAIGDCTDRVNLTPVATSEGTLLAENLFNGKNYKMEYSNIPSAVFSQPPLSTVGLTEAEARSQFGEVDVYVSQFRALKFTLSPVQEKTHMKLIVDPKTDRVVGCHMIGADAPEIVQGVAIAIKAGATKQDFDSTVGIHPTSAEEFVTMRTKR
ncbi:MAG: glutathione-disulfide reductase [Bdellovibrionaceae bacterium]|nr:glutathione-disulfide reductase [Pseudobdellovibrionaceae bacterium]